jgi:hypothetical protein
MAALKRIPDAERANFSMDEDGSYIHWPGPDIHLDLDAVRVAIDWKNAPKPRLRKPSMMAGVARRSPDCDGRSA